MSHYYISDESLKNVDYIVRFTIFDKEIILHSNNGVFSKNRVDIGTYFFLKSIIPLNINGKILDFGAGIGTVGITLNLFFKELDVTYCEINDRALELVNKNLKQYNLNGEIVRDINSYINVFDYAFLNPPIRCGKEAVYNIYKDIYKALKENGELYIVIRKDKGMNSHKKFLLSMFKEVEVIAKDKGYYVLKMIK